MNARKAAVKWAGAGVLSVMLASAPAFAAGQWNRDGQNRDRQNANGQATQTQAQTQAQTGQPGADRTSYQRRNGQQQVNVAPVAQPTFTAQRNDQNRYRNSNQSQYNAYQSRSRGDQSSVYRENQRANISGRVQSFSRERNGYRVHLDSGSYWIPESRFGNRARDLRVGVSLSLGGIFRGGIFGIDAVSWGANSGYGYDQGYVRGVVQHVDYRSGMLTLRDASTGRLFEVDMRDAGGARLGRGEFVTLSGRWIQGNLFAAYRVDSVG
jgi:hypothetical protein